MATTAEKVKAFLDRFGKAGEDILQHAEEVEKEAKALGVAFKESDDTTDETELLTEKARKKSPKPKQRSLFEEETEDAEEDEAEEEELEEEMGEEVELKKRAKDDGDEPIEAAELPDAEDAETFLDDLDEEYSDDELDEEEIDESEEDELDESEEKDYEFVMGNMTLKEYGDMMAEVFVEALAPMAEELGEIRKLLGRRKEADNLMLESQLEHGQAIESLKKQFDTIEATLKATRKTLSAMVDEQPKTVVKNFIASEAEETMVSDDHRLKQASPSPDPLADFTKFVVGGSL